MSMMLHAFSGLALALAPPVGGGGAAVEAAMLDSGSQSRDQDAALAARREGRALPLSEIQRRVVPTMKDAKYLGFDFDSSTAVYTLKFLRDGSLIWVMVDGRSGNVIGRSGR